MAGLTGNRKADYEFNMAVIRASDLRYEVRNEGHHVMIFTRASRFNFWPASGKWTEGVRRTKQHPGSSRLFIHMGVFSLLEAVQNKVAQVKESKE